MMLKDLQYMVDKIFIQCILRTEILCPNPISQGVKTIAQIWLNAMQVL